MSDEIPSIDPSKGLYPPMDPRKIGSRLYDRASQFYTWYLEWNRSPQDNVEAFHHLNKLLKIALLSVEKGGILETHEEKQTVESLDQMKDAIESGNLGSYHIPRNLEKIVNTLVEQNPKAKLIASLMELKEHYEHQESKDLSSEGQKLLGDIIENIFSHINSGLQPFHARVLTQQIQKMLLQDPHNALVEELEKTINNWLS